MVKCSLLLCYLEEPSEEDKTAIKEGIREWARDLQSPDPLQFYTRDGSWWIEAIATLSGATATAIIGWLVRRIADQLFPVKAKELQNKNISLPSGPATLESPDDMRTEIMQTHGQVDEAEMGWLTEDRLADIAHILGYLPARAKPQHVTFMLFLDETAQSVTVITDDQGVRPVLVAEGKPDHIRRLAIELVADSVQNRDC
jgi:hypothetical protein